MLIREGRRQGVRGIVVTHADSPIVAMSIPEMREAARMGAFLELVYAKPGSELAKAHVAAVRAVGPEHFILSSDLGQAGNRLHPDGLLELYRYLKQQGFNEAEIDLMAKTNPAKALGLDW